MIQWNEYLASLQSIHSYYSVISITFQESEVAVVGDTERSAKMTEPGGLKMNSMSLSSLTNHLSCYQQLPKEHDCNDFPVCKNIHPNV